METNHLQLNNGLFIPQIGLGVFQIPYGPDTERVVKTALKKGYRHIDTAHAYLNEKSVGKAIRESGIPREKIWVTSKLWPSEYEDPKAVDKMIERLGIGPLDLILLHQQTGDYKSGWRHLEEAYHSKKVRSIGISNFDGERLDDIYSFSKIKPAIIQVETHPYNQQQNLANYIRPYKTIIESWYPLGHGDPKLIGESIFIKLGKKYDKSSVQIILRWHIQKGFIVFPSSKSETHLEENFDIFDFELTEDEMRDIEKLDGKRKYFTMTYEEQVENLSNWNF